MSWFYLFIAGLLEVGWAVGLKDTVFSRPVPTLLTLTAMAGSMALLGLGGEEPADRDRVRGLDGDRNPRHGDTGHGFSGRTGDRGAGGVPGDGYGGIFGLKLLT